MPRHLLHWDTKAAMESGYCTIQGSITNDIGSQLDGFLEFIGVDPELRTVLIPGFNTISESSPGAWERNSLFSLLNEPGSFQSSNDLVGPPNPSEAANDSVSFRLRPEVNNIEPLLDADSEVRDVAVSAASAPTFEAKPKRCTLFRIDF